VHCDDALLPYVSVMSAVESLHRMTREDRDLDGLIVRGSDNLTAYNVYAEAFAKCGYVGEVYGLPRHLFDAGIEQWAERRGVLVKAIEDAALGMASIFRAVKLPLPVAMPFVNDSVERRFVDLLAKIQPFDLVIDEVTADGHEARVSKTSVAGSWGAISGTLRYFADAYGNPRAAIEGTNVPMTLIKRYATSSAQTLVYDPRHKQSPLAMERKVDYFGFELEREREAVHDFPAGMEREAQTVLAGALARGEARHAAVMRNRQPIEEVREAYRRSGAATPRLGLAELTAWYADQLRDARNLHEYRAAPLRFDADDFVPRATRVELSALPGAAEIRDRTVPMHYEIEETREGPLGVVRLVIPEKIARGLVQEELPDADRPLRFTVTRGGRGSVKAASLNEIAEALERPYTDEELRRSQERTPYGSRGPNPSRDGRDGRTGGGGPSRHGKQKGGHDKASHRPGSPSGRGKRRGRGR
jgi:ATP-dependent helicase HrpA